MLNTVSMETCLGSHLSGSSKLIPEADELQILACSWSVWTPWFVLMKIDLQPPSQMFRANLLPWVAYLCTSSISLSSYARLWSSKAVLHVLDTFLYVLSCQLSWDSNITTSEICQSPTWYLLPFFSHLLFDPNVFSGNEVSEHISLPAASRFCQDFNNQSSKFFEAYV